MTIVFWLVLVSTLLSGLNLFSAWHPWLELNHNLAIYYLFVHLLSLPLMLICRRRPARRPPAALLSAVLILSLYYAAQLWPFYISDPAPAPDAGLRVKVLIANLETQDKALLRLLECMRQSSPQVVGVTAAPPQAAELLADRFPYRLEISPGDRRGVALYSQYPMRQENFAYWDSDPAPVLAAVLTLPGGREIEFLLVQGFFPWSRGFALNRVGLRRVATAVRRSHSTVIVAGTLNITPFSGFWGMLEDGAGLSNASYGFGLNRTWRAGSWFLRLTLDHILYRGDLQVGDFRVLPEIGTEHFPVMAEFVME